MTDSTQAREAWEISVERTKKEFEFSQFGGGFVDAAIFEVATSRNYISALESYLARVTRERDALQQKNELLSDAFDVEATVKEMSMKMAGSHAEGTAVFGDEAHPAFKILAAAALALLGIDGETPPNYMTASLHGRLANFEAEYFIEIASCKSANQTPHALRMKAEDELERTRAALTEANEKLEAVKAKVDEGLKASVHSPQNQCEDHYLRTLRDIRAALTEAVIEGEKE